MKRKSRSRQPTPSSHPSPAAPPPPPPEPPPITPVRPELQGKLARAMLTPEMAAAESMGRVMDPCLAEAGLDMRTVAKLLEERGQAAADGDLSLVRRTLTAQVAMLDRIFHHLFSLATVDKNTPETCGCFMRLALRAQTQSARTSAILARLSGEIPRVAPAKPMGTQPVGPGQGTSTDRASRGSAATAVNGPRPRFVVPVPVGLTMAGARLNKGKRCRSTDGRRREAERTECGEGVGGKNFFLAHDSDVRAKRRGVRMLAAAVRSQLAGVKGSRAWFWSNAMSDHRSRQQAAFRQRQQAARNPRCSARLHTRPSPF